jgi:hypothetical protein
MGMLTNVGRPETREAPEGETNLGSKWEYDFRDFDIPHLASGELKYSEEVHRGLDKVGGLSLALQKGQNKGKVVIGCR